MSDRSPTRTRLGAGILLVVAIILVAACGGGGKNALTPSTGAGTTQTTGLAGTPTEPQNAGAGNLPGVTLNGTVVADSGFRPNPNGFSIQNYGNEGLFAPDGMLDTSRKPENMAPAQVSAIFGDQVCETGSGSSCQLNLLAQNWLSVTNQNMADGHCYGFSDAALRLFAGYVKPTDFGAGNTYGLQPSPRLEQEIAQDWAFQTLKSVQNDALAGTPTETLNTLQKVFEAEKAHQPNAPYYTMRIFKPDGGGGHAITPFAVVDHGGGVKGIGVYDNNFPGQTQEVMVDTNKDSWSYTAKVNPGAPPDTYTGAGKDNEMQLFPVKTGVQPCDFCNGDSIQSNQPHSGSILSAKQQYNQIALLGDPSNHAHLVLSDAQGHQSGYVNGKLVNDIPGVQIDDYTGDQDWAEQPDPTFHVPVNLNVNLTIDGGTLTRPDTEELTLIGPGDYNNVQDIKIAPGQTDTIDFTGDGTGYAYKTADNQTESPVLTAGAQGKQADFGFAIKAVNTQGGATIDTQLDQQKQQFDVDTTGSGSADYVISVVRQETSGETTWSTEGIPNSSLRLQDADKVHIDYGTSTQPGMPLKVTINKKDGTTMDVELPQKH